MAGRESLGVPHGLGDPAGDRSEEIRRAATANVARAASGPSLAASVARLQSLAARAPWVPGLLSDLAAARFVLAVQDDEPAELVKALGAAEEAVRVDPALPEARFNRALVLDRLFLRDQAVQAWGDYLQLDPHSGWADEARAHLSRLAIPSPGDLWARDLPSLTEATREEDDRALQDRVTRTPQEAREHAVEALLGRWGDLVLAGRSAEADAPLRVARKIGEALVAANGDRTVQGTVAAIDRAARGSDPTPTLAALARGLRAYRDGIHAFREQNLEAAEPRLAEARAALGPDGPVALWALLGLAGIEVYRSRFASAESLLESVRRRARRLGSSALAGRAEWSSGLGLVRQGRFSASLSRYGSAARRLAAAREVQGTGAVEGLLAENLRFLGQPAAAWRHRYRALAELAAYRDSIRLHNVLWEGGWAAVEEGEPRAALTLQEEGLRVAERSRQPRMLSEALTRRSRIELALGDPRAALASLARAGRLIEEGRGPGDWARRRLRMDIAYLRGEATRRLNPEAALVDLTRALALYRANGLALDLAEVLLSRSRAYLAVGEDHLEEADLEAAINLFETQRGGIFDDGSRLSFSEAAQDLFDERIVSLAERRNDPRAALKLSERARIVPLSSHAKPLRARSIERLLAAIPDGTVVLEYSLVRDRLFVWALRHDRLDFVRRSIAPGVLSHLISRFTRDIRSDVPQERLATTASRLHDLLLPGELAIPPGAELFFVPDKQLNSIPFAALRDPVRKRYLIEDHPIHLLPSASLYAASPRRRTGARRRALLVGATVWDAELFRDLPSLSGAAMEISRIRDLYASPRVLLGGAATPESLLAELGRYDVVHIAGHSVFNPQHPEHSYLVLAPGAGDNGALFASTLAGRRFGPLGLVVLAACRSLGPLDSRTQGLAGLARPFLDAGVPAVVGTLWDVDDARSAHLLPDFHRRYLASGDAATALREAQLALLRSHVPSLRAPSAWAGFQVVGVGD